MALRTDFYVDLFLCRSCHECVSTVACNCCLIILRMDSCFHFFHLFFLFCELLHTAQRRYAFLVNAAQMLPQQDTPDYPCKSLQFCPYEQHEDDTIVPVKKQYILNEFLSSDLLHKLPVVPRMHKHIQNIFYCLVCLHSVEGTTHDIDCLLLFTVKQQIITARS